MTHSHRRMFRAAAAALCVGIASVDAAAQDTRSARVDSIFATFTAPGSPGCAVGVVQDGSRIYARGYGSANLDYDVPLDERSVFYLASVSKQFTAAAIVLAAADGKLSLDDDVRKYITELPDYGAPITIRQLVHHTSGIRDYLTLISLAGRSPDDAWTDAALLALVARQRSLNFAPGSEHLYSNTGYVLLAEIVRRATGKSLREYADARIFQPLGMRDTHFHDDASAIVPRRAIGYTRDVDGRWRMNHWFTFDKVGDGGLYSSVEDLVRWDANFSSGTVGGAALLQQMQQRGVLANGDTLVYAFGLTLGSYRGLHTSWHGGSLTGFRTVILRMTEQRFSAIVLCNAATANPLQLARRIAEVYLEDHMTPDAPPVTTTTNLGAAQQIARPDAVTSRSVDVVGSYRSEELDAVYDFRADGDQLVLQRGSTRVVFRAAATDVFSAGNTTLRFARGEDGRITGFLLDAGRVRGIRFDRIHDSR